jgi:hypothetical protein
VKSFAICVLALSLGLSVRPFPGFAQTSAGTGSGSSAQASSGSLKPSLGFDMSEFPLWAKDLRRAEIVAFGSFPFSMFFTTFAMDTWRCFSHDWDPLYAPWPAKPPGAINMTQDELGMTIAIAAAVSVAIAVTDFSIVQIKRHQEKQRMKKLPAGSPITIIQKPLAGPESAAGPESQAEAEPGTGQEAETGPAPGIEPEPAVRPAQPFAVPPPSP